MKPADLLTRRNWPSILMYGPAGCGKTALLSQAKNCYIFDFDDGMRTAAVLDDKFKEQRHQCEFDIYKEENPLNPKRWLAAEKKINELAQLSANNKLPYDCICIDSFSGLCMAIRYHCMNLTGDPFAKPQIQHWGTMINIVEKVLTILRSLKCLLIVAAHEMAIEVSGTHLIRPMSMTEKHGMNKMMWLFDEVWHMKVRPAGPNKHKYLVSTHSTDAIAARTRSNMQSDVDFTEIGLAGLLEMIEYKEERNKDASTEQKEK